LLKGKPLILAHFMVLLLNGGLVSEFKCFHFLAFLFSRFLSISLRNSQMVRKFKFADFFLLLAIVLSVLLESLCKLLLFALVAGYLIGCDPNVVERHNLAVLKLEEGDAEADLISSHVCAYKLLGFLLFEAPLNLAFIPHSVLWVNS
jgi:hypothetical protein